VVGKSIESTFLTDKPLRQTTKKDRPYGVDFGSSRGKSKTLLPCQRIFMSKGAKVKSRLETTQEPATNARNPHRGHASQAPLATFVSTRPQFRPELPIWVRPHASNGTLQTSSPPMTTKPHGRAKLLHHPQWVRCIPTGKADISIALIDRSRDSFSARPH